MSSFALEKFGVFLISASFASGCTVTIPMDPKSPVDIGESGLFAKYYQEGGMSIQLDQWSMYKELERNPVTKSDAKVAKEARIIAIVANVLGAVALGASTPLINNHLNYGEPGALGWMLLGTGGGLLLAAFPFALYSSYRLESAVVLHNQSLTKPATPHTVTPPATNSQKAGNVAVEARRPDEFGFDFDKPQPDATTACLLAGFQPATKNGILTCSGLPKGEVSSATAELTFAGDRISKMQIIVRPPADAGEWKRSFRKLESALRTLYGIPDQRSFIVPDECDAAEQFMECVSAGKVSGSANWSGARERSVSMSISGSPAPPVITAVIVRTPPIDTQ